MVIEASVRPRGLKRGVSNKKFCKALGFEQEVGLTQLVGRIELSGEEPKEFGFLTQLFSAFHPLTDQKTRITVEVGGKLVGEYTSEGKI